MLPLDRPFAFVDLETTGATATVDRIAEIAIVTWDGVECQRWSQLVNPEARIPPFIEQLTGISNAMVSDQPVFAEVATEVLQRLSGHLFVAHNARFDYGFLKNECRRIGLDYRAPVLCTVKLSRLLYPEFAKHNLDALIERHGLEASTRHRALADAEAIFSFWQVLTQQFSTEQLSEHVRQLTARGSLPPHLDPELVDALPEGHGVYLLYGENDLPLYVGKSKTLRQRVLAHFAADHAAAKEMSLSQQVRRLDWIECAGEIESLLTESRLVKQLQPTLNRQLRRNRDLCGWQLREVEEGQWQPHLVYARDLEFGRQEQLYGLFNTAREAKTALTGLVKSHELCPVTLGLEKGSPGKPCFARQLRRCRGACCGAESLMQHSLRLMSALGSIKLKSWPFSGPALLREGQVCHVIDAWCYLGTARSDDEIHDILHHGKPVFDRDTYRILLKAADRLEKL